MKALMAKVKLPDFGMGELIFSAIFSNKLIIYSLEHHGLTLDDLFSSSIFPDK